MNVDEAVDTLQRGLDDFSQDWADEIEQITCEYPAWEETSAVDEADVFDAVVTMAAESLDTLGVALCNISRQISTLKR